MKFIEEKNKNYVAGRLDSIIDEMADEVNQEKPNEYILRALGKRYDIFLGKAKKLDIDTKNYERNYQVYINKLNKKLN